MFQRRPTHRVPNLVVERNSTAEVRSLTCHLKHHLKLRYNSIQAVLYVYICRHTVHTVQLYSYYTCIALRGIVYTKYIHVHVLDNIEVYIAIILYICVFKSYVLYNVDIGKNDVF